MDIKELMTDDIGMVTEFEEACNDMESCRYILADGKIIKILQIIALSNVLQNVIGGALKGFNYAETARTWQGGFVEPATEKDHVAITVCILSDIDNGKIILSDFLRRFFWVDNINTSYSAFCGKLIEPFKRYVVDAAMRATKDFSNVEQIAQAIAAKVEQMDLDFSDKTELILLCDGAAKARLNVSEARNSAMALLDMLRGSNLEAMCNELVNALSE